jgi:pyruvate dehydrogenase E2 component (dihydrolipoamide acetyltransferase)
MRKTIANRLLESKTTIPHYYLTKSVIMDDSLKLRQTLNQTPDVKISVNDMIIKAASLACVKVPEVNS